MKKRLVLAFGFAFWVYALALVVLSLLPSTQIQELTIMDKEWRIDYPLHALAFLALPFIAFFASYNGANKKLWRILLLTSFLLSVGTEFVQIYSGRTFNLWDIASNILGLTLGFLMLKILYRRSLNRTS